MSTLITNLFHISSQTNTNSPCSIHELESQPISLPCHFHNQPFHVHFMPRIYSSLSFITHTPSHSCIFIPFMPSYNNPINYMPNIKGQERNHQTRAYHRPTLRSGWRVSLRRKGLSLRRAPFCLDESSINLIRTKRANSLRRALLTWARQSLAQNQNHPPRWPLAQRAWASLR